MSNSVQFRPAAGQPPISARIAAAAYNTGVCHELTLTNAPAVVDLLTEFIGRHGVELVHTTPDDVVMPIMHGKQGEDGQIQRLLDEAGTPYLGSGVAASELCFDKVRLKALLVKHGIETPQSEVVTAESFAQSKLVRAPFVLKPVADGSSVGMLIARRLPYDRVRVRELLAEQGEMLLEELIVGTEITVPVLDTKALPVIEIVPPPGQEFDYENKYNGATAELCPPRTVKPEVQKQARRLAERVHKLAGVRHLSRTDMMAAQDGRLYVLEINTMPGMTAQSLYPKSAAAAGLTWVKLVERLVELAQG